MRGITILIIAALATMSLMAGVVSAKPVKAIKAPEVYYPTKNLFALIWDTLPITPYRSDVPEAKLDKIPGQLQTQRIQVTDDWPTTPYREDLPEQVCK